MLGKSPVTTPLELPTLTLPLALLHVPPAGVEFNVVAKPTQTLGIPVIVPGLGFTVTVALSRQPVGNSYVIVEVPWVFPVTIPVEPIPALLLLLSHVPPAGEELNAVVKPMQTFSVPVIGAGLGLTVIVVVFIHPVPRVYVITVVVLGTNPVTIPDDDPTVASTILLEPHVPPAGVEFKVVVKPTHTFVIPVIGVGLAFTVTFIVVIADPHEIFDSVKVIVIVPAATP